jgi:hypothetical protein
VRSKAVRPVEASLARSARFGGNGKSVDRRSMLGCVRA